jgi:hypothetical protein
MLTIDISDSKLVILEEEIIELWTGIEMTKTMYDKILSNIRNRIDFMTPKGGSDEG